MTQIMTNQKYVDRLLKTSSVHSKYLILLFLYYLDNRIKVLEIKIIFLGRSHHEVLYQPEYYLQ